MTAVLEILDVDVRFGGVHAVDGVTIRVDRGEIVGLIGPNGAGKTTTIDAVCGFVSAAGVVTVDGRDVTRSRAHARARAGLSRTFQSLELFEDMTIAENLSVAAESLVERGRRGDVRERAAVALQRVGLDVDLDSLPSGLPNGDRKLLAVARALMGEPALLLLDEPGAGLNSTESQQLGERLRSLQSGGASILLVDHDMGLVSHACDRVYVLNFGRLIAEGRPDEILRDPEVIAAYLGGATDATVAR